jgi:hypothetical protein
MLYHAVQLKSTALAFWNDTLKPLLSPLIPADQYVLDLFYDAPNSKWMVVEVNPWITSSFWLFSPGESVLQTGPTEMRVATHTKHAELVSQLPPSWWAVIEQSSDVYDTTPS